jgi:long-chain acyl-CoA synthetase
MGIHHQLLTGAAHSHDTTAWWWIERDRRLTYADAVEQVDRMAGALLGLGVGRGDRVGVYAHSGLDFVVTLFGAWRIGAAAAVVDVDTADLASFLGTAHPQVLVYTHDRFDRVAACRDLVGELVCMDGPQEGARGLAEVLASAAAPPAAVAGDDDDDGAVALVTADGSFTVGALLDAADRARDTLALLASDVVLGASPLWDVDHTAANLLPALSAGATAAVSSRWSPATGCDVAERIGATILTVTAEQTDDFLAECTARTKVPLGLRMLQVVGGPVGPEVVDNAAALGLAVTAGPAPAPASLPEPAP